MTALSPASFIIVTLYVAMGLLSPKGFTGCAIAPASKISEPSCLASFKPLLSDSIDEPIAILVRSGSLHPVNGCHQF